MSFELIQIDELYEQSVNRRTVASRPSAASKPTPSSAPLQLPQVRPACLAKKLIQVIVFTADITCHLNSRKVGGGKRARSRTRKLLHWLLNPTNLLVLVSLVCLCHVGLSLYYQYLHNIYAIRQNRLDAAVANGKRLLLAGTDSTNATLARLSRLIAEAELELSRIGAPLVSDSLLLKCAILVLSTWTVAVYYLTVVFCSKNNLGSYYIRMVQSTRTELLAMNRLIRTQLNKLLESSFNFARKMTLEVLRMHRSEQFRLSEAAPSPRQNPHLLRAWQNYLNTVEHSLSLFESGQLLEFFRPLAFYDRLYLFNVVYHVGSMALVLLLVLPSFLAPTLNASQLKLDLANPRNVLVWLELAFLTALSLDVLLFFGSVFLMTCLDQWRLISKLKASIADSILANKLQFDKLFRRANRGAPAQSPIPPATQQAMNERFLLVLIEYRLFQAHSMSINRLSNYITMMTLLVVTIVTVAVRMHAPYMSAHEKLLVIAFSVVSVALALVHLTPTCHFHERFKQLHRLLMSLMAHLVETSELAKSSACKNASAASEVYDEHIVWLVREELLHPEHLSQQLTPRIFNTPVTYPNTLRLIFWLSLVIISNASEFHPENSTHLLSYLDDPLGVLSARNL